MLLKDVGHGSELKAMTVCLHAAYFYSTERIMEIFRRIKKKNSSYYSTDFSYPCLSTIAER